MILIGITGTNGSGKGVVVEYLVNQKSFAYYSNSGYISEELKRRGMELSRSNMRMVGNEFREKYGSAYLVEVALKKAQESKAAHVVVEAIRSSGEAEKIKEVGGVLWVVDAERKLRYDRIYARRSGKDLVDFDAFVEQEEREWFGREGQHDMNMKKVMEMADDTIFNSGTLEELHIQIERALKKILG